MSKKLTAYDLYEAVCEVTREPLACEKFDGKTIGTTLERHVHTHLTNANFEYEAGCSNRGVDFPCVGVDLKAVNFNHTQSSSSFGGFREAIYGLPYDLIVCFYEPLKEQRLIKINEVRFVARRNARDAQLVMALREVLQNDVFMTRGELEEAVRAIFARKFNGVAMSDKLLQEVMARGVCMETPDEVPLLRMTAITQWKLTYVRPKD